MLKLCKEICLYVAQSSCEKQCSDRHRTVCLVRPCLAQHSACRALTLPHTISASNTTHTLHQFAASLLPPELYTLQSASLPAQVALLLCFSSDVHYFSSFPSHSLFIVPTISSHHLKSSPTLARILPSRSERSLRFLESLLPNPASIASNHPSLNATIRGALSPASTFFHLVSFSPPDAACSELIYVMSPSLTTLWRFSQSIGLFAIRFET